MKRIAIPLLLCLFISCAGFPFGNQEEGLAPSTPRPDGASVDATDNRPGIVATEEGTGNQPNDTDRSDSQELNPASPGSEKNGATHDAAAKQFDAAGEKGYRGDSARDIGENTRPDDPKPGVARPLSQQELGVLLSTEVSPPAPVTREGVPFAYFLDIDSDGLLEVYALSVDDIHPEHRRYEALTDFSRMLDTTIEIPTYYLVVYIQDQNRIVRMEEIKLGKYPVLDSFTTRRISPNKNRPLCIYASFQMQEGLYTEWTIFSTTSKYSRFSFRESAAVSTVIDDIDRDGIIDVLIFERVLEEGTGYETLVSWYQWNGVEYLRKGTTNIVRNLKAFLDTSKSMILKGDWEAFSKFALDPEQLRKNPYTHMPAVELSGLPFRDAESEDTGEADGKPQGLLLTGTEIIAVTFPEFYENPFVREESGSYLFPMKVKFIFSDRRESLAQAVVIMRRNPFEGGQFYFRILYP